MKWDVVVEKAIKDDGSLYFEKRLSREFLLNVRKSQGSYIFANQYQNEIIPEDEKKFKAEWIRYYRDLPDRLLNFGFIDPAISHKEGSDFTALVIVSVDVEGTWYVRHAMHAKLTPTEQLDLAFKACFEWKLTTLGIEDIAYQRALLYMIADESKRRGVVLPITGIGLGDARHKDTRILGLVPRFEWSRIFLAPGFLDLENELKFFPRGKKDIVDALARIEQIAYAPQRERKSNEPPAPNSPSYESWYIKNIHRRNDENS